MSVVFRIQGLHYYLPSQSQLNVTRYPLIKPNYSQQIWSDIDSRNKLFLQPTTVSPRLTDNFFDFTSHRSYRPPRIPPEQTDQQLSSYSKRPPSPSLTNDDPAFIFGNSILKSNKAELLNIFEEKFFHGEKANTYINKHGVVITEDGPFWPDDYRILHPTPKFLRRELTSKEFYLSPLMSSKTKGKRKEKLRI